MPVPARRGILEAHEGLSSCHVMPVEAAQRELLHQGADLRG